MRGRDGLFRAVAVFFIGLASVIGLLMLFPQEADASPMLQADDVSQFEFDSISSQTAGDPFIVTITAQDAAGNTVAYTGTADLSDSTGTIEPTTTGSFSGGVWTGSVTITGAMSGVVITATAGTASGTSNAFDVEPGDLDYFTFDTIPSPQTAGAAFEVTIRAFDGEDNPKTDYAGPADLSDSTGTIEPTTTGSFTDGVWTGDVTITAADTDVTITVEDGGSDSSNAFDVEPGDLDYFTFDTIPSPQTAGAAFEVTIRAFDGEDNPKTDYAGPADLSDSTGTIEPTTTGSFTDGVWTGDVTITAADTDVTITVEDGGSDSSNAFDVEPGDLDYFTFDTISSPQTAGEPFEVTIRAFDGEDNPKTDYAGPADLSDSTGTIEPTTTGSFTDGLWTGDVTITAADTDVTITVEDGVSDTSNTFDVDPAALHHLVISPTVATISAGSMQPYTAEAFDAFDNTRGDVTEHTIFSIDESGHGGSWSDNVYTSQNYGTWTVRGTYTGTIVVADTASLTVLDADLRFGKDDRRSVVGAGERLTYTLVYTNSGNELAGGIVITDTLPDYVTYVGCQVGVGNCRRRGGSVVFDGISLSAGESGRAQLVVRVINPLPTGAAYVTNQARMAAPSLTTPITVQDVDAIGTRPDLTISVTHAPSLFSPGGLMTYTVIYGNRGRMNASGVVISTTLPPGTSYAGDDSWSPAGGSYYSYSVDDLDAGTGGEIALFVVRHPPGAEVGAASFATEFTIAADAVTGGEANYSDNRALGFVGVPDLVVTGINVSPWPLEPNVPTVFTITVKNQGTGWGWNPDNRAGFWVDVFFGLVSSYPFERECDKGIAGAPPPLAPGAEYVQVIANPWYNNQAPILFGAEEIARINSVYVKVDNFRARAYGLVPEYDELNNVSVTRDGILTSQLDLYRVYLPFVRRQD